MRSRIIGLLSLCGAVASASLFWTSGQATLPSVFAAELGPEPRMLRRAPIDLALSPDEAWLVAINQHANTAQLIDTRKKSVVDELPIGDHPRSIAMCPDRPHAIISESYSGTVAVVAIEKGRLKRLATIDVAMEPFGVAVSPDGRTAYVARSAAGDVAVIDLTTNQVTGAIAVGRWPRRLAVSPNGKRLAVAAAGDGAIAVVDTAAGEVLYHEKFKGLNLGHLQVDNTGEHVYFPRLFYGDNPTSVANIRRGWVVASRVGRIGLDGPKDRHGFSLDPRGRAVGDPHGLALSPDGNRLVLTAGGTHELLVLQFEGLPWIGIGGSDHINPELLADANRFARIDLGGRPLGVCIAQDNRTAYVANAQLGSVQVVDLQERKLQDEISLGEYRPASEHEAQILRGEALFFDATLSLDQWYSCHSCHFEGGSNIESMDTLNDGSAYTFKSVLPLYFVGETAPWTWHGRQPSLRDSVYKSITVTMRGPEPTDSEVDALVAYLKSLRTPPNPYQQQDAPLSETAQRGQKVFASDRAGCANCHTGPYFTDGEIHDVGLGGPDDRYEGFNTPTLRGVYRKTRLLHHGRAHSLEELLTDLHNPARVTGSGELTADERSDLIEYLKTL